jgi:hypothetical protein
VYHGIRLYGKRRRQNDSPAGGERRFRLTGILLHLISALCATGAAVRFGPQPVGSHGPIFRGIHTLGAQILNVFRFY